PASTPVQEIARATMSQYKPEIWPQDRSGHARPAVVDQLNEDGTVRRLDPAATLHESDTGDGATLHVAPETTAGAGPEPFPGGSGSPRPPFDRFPEPPLEPQRRYLNAWLPEKIRLGHCVPLLVRVSLQAEPGRSTNLRPLPISIRGIEVTLQV